MLNFGWKKARARAGLEQVRFHDLEHAFGRRLRAAGVSFEDRQDLLGHRSGRITSHGSAAELSRLIEAAEKVCERGGRWPEMAVLRGTFATCSRKKARPLSGSAEFFDLLAGELGFEPRLTESETGL